MTTDGAGHEGHDDWAAAVGEVLGEPPRGIGYRRLAPSPVDARLFLGRTPTADQRRSLAALFGGDPRLESFAVQGRELTLRFTNEHVRESIVPLQERGAAGLFERPPLGGRSAVVNFLNPNATKPLHVGHLRNLALGESVAALLGAAGARVTRQVYVCDIGRNVCEALAGWQARGVDAAPAADERPDVFVGRCYAEYASLRAPASEGVDPVDAEAASLGDAAEAWMVGWLAGDIAMRADWRRLVDWALDGQRRTLSRVGVRFDRVQLESEAVEPIRRLAEEGVRVGVLERGVDGSIHYPTGRADYARLPLIRADGFPTEHARVIGLFVAERRAARSDERWIVVCGDEWSAAGEAELEVAARLAPDVDVRTVEILAHGMVTLSGSKMKSRDGRALLLDELLDRLAREPSVLALVDRSRGRTGAELVAQIVARVGLLVRKPHKAVEFRYDDLLDPARNPAWALAEAWARAPLEDTPADPEDVRTAAMQIHHLRTLVTRAAADLRPAEVALFAGHVAKWALERPPAAELVHVLDGLWRATLEVLGFSGLPSRATS